MTRFEQGFNDRLEKRALSMTCVNKEAQATNIAPKIQDTTVGKTKPSLPWHYEQDGAYTNNFQRILNRGRDKGLDLYNRYINRNRAKPVK